MKKMIGFFLLLAVIVVAAVFAFRNKKAEGGAVVSGNLIHLKGLIGGEKMALMADPDVTNILAKKYKVAVDVTRRGSIEMVTDQPAADIDFLWPSSQIALQFYQEKSWPMKQSEIIFNSPMVFYSWSRVADALVKKGLVHRTGDVYFVDDVPKLLELCNSGAAWKDMGIPELFGKVNIFSTDPNQSNSGNMFAGILANELNGGEVATEAKLTTLLPEIRSFFDRQGFMETSSEVLFNQFLEKGMGDKPIIVGYEAQLLGYRSENQAAFQRTGAVVMLYPKPTVWSSHPLIALDENARRLITALQDPEIQKIAWEHHGFRSAASQGSTTYAKLGVPGTIDYVMPMPSAKVMHRILDSLK